MPSIRFTAAAVEKLLLPTSGRTDVYDVEVPGLVLRMSSSGVKSWSFMYRVAGKTQRLTLGNHPGLTLKLARDRAREARAATQRGEDPVADKKAAELDRKQNGFSSCVHDFVEKYAMRSQKTWKATKSSLTRYAVAEWGDKPAKEIRRRDVVALLDQVTLGMAPYQADLAGGSYQFKVDATPTVWPTNSDPNIVIAKQSTHPDGSKLWLTFETTTQFPGGGPQRFTAIFEHGRVVAIEKVQS